MYVLPPPPKKEREEKSPPIVMCLSIVVGYPWYLLKRDGQWINKSYLQFAHYTITDRNNHSPTELLTSVRIGYDS